MMDGARWVNLFLALKERSFGNMFFDHFESFLNAKLYRPLYFNLFLLIGLIVLAGQVPWRSTKESYRVSTWGVWII